MRVVVDRPCDHQIWHRAETIAGWVEGVSSLAGWHATCGGTAVHLGSCLHPRGATRDDVHGFWTEIFVQRHAEAIRDGMLVFELWHGATRVAAVPLWVMPQARELATSHPLDLGDYVVSVSVDGARSVPRTLVFPGLGAVGGASLDRLLRTKMLREGWTTPVYDEPNAPPLWARLRDRHRSLAFRWIDGHACWDAVPIGGGDAVRVTMLRDPIRRMVSIFNYGIVVHPERFAGASFDAFVAAGAARAHAQARGLLRVAGRDAERDGATLHRAARRELETGYALVGITERFDETVFLLCRLAGYATIGMWHAVLAAPRAVDPERLSTSTRTRLARDLAVDLELYAEARAGFEERVAAADLGPAFARYREASARRNALSEAAKATECLRWRHVLSEHARLPVGSMVADGSGRDVPP